MTFQTFKEQFAPACGIVRLKTTHPERTRREQIYIYTTILTTYVKY